MASDTIYDILKSYFDGSTTIQANAALATRIDGVGGGITYVGKAVAGASTASAVWQIQRLTESGADTTVQWADGNGNFDNIWDNRLSLTYS